MNNTFSKSALRKDLSEAAAQRGLLSGFNVHLFAEVSGEAASADTATVSYAGTPGKTSLRRRVGNHDLPYTEESDQVVSAAPQIQGQYKTLPYL